MECVNSGNVEISGLGIKKTQGKNVNLEIHY